jgi:DNA transposition AAA+ family ATPase
LTDPKIKPSGTATIAALRNVEAFYEALDAAQRRVHHLPGLVVFHGPSGYGKTFSAQYAANTHSALYVEARSTWTKRALCRAILAEIGLEPAQRVYEMSAQIAEALLYSRRPLILDEADHVLAAGAIEIVRDIHEASGAVIAMIGEERLPNKLRAVERVHNRVIAWVAAQPTDLADAQALARLYCPGLTVADDLLAQIVDASEGGARRVCINLHAVLEEARRRPGPALDRAWWGDRPLHTGRVQPRATPFRPGVAA